MCGIFATLCNTPISPELRQQLVEYCEKIRHRGPDNTHYLDLDEGRLLFGFHRLAINDVTELGDQPLALDDSYFVICNGEIYNHSELEKKYDIKTKGHSDCEIILHLHKKFGFERMLQEISGYYAIVLWDKIAGKLYAARDPIGVRSMFIGKNPVTNSITICSEMKGIPKDCEITQFPGGSWLELSGSDAFNGTFHKYYNFDYKLREGGDLEEELSKIRHLFEKAVYKRFMFERPFGVFLSGGLDSSLVAALVAKHNAPEPIHSFSIGFAGSPDLKNARLVADHIKSIHHEVIVTEQEMLDAIPRVIKQIETYDTTTVRASIPMFLLSEYIKKNTDIVVIFSGEGSDEASGSYLYFHDAPDDDSFEGECVRLLKDLHYFDCLRCDKATAAHSLEVRVPFLDREFIDAYMCVPIKWKRPHNGMEKWFIRKAFDGIDLIPDAVLWRQKEAFSDGVSGQERSWFSILQAHIDGEVSDEEFRKMDFKHNEPKMKESYYYRKLFEEFYPGRAETIPYLWLPKWSEHDGVDPSARVLKVYGEN